MLDKLLSLGTNLDFDFLVRVTGSDFFFLSFLFETFVLPLIAGGENCIFMAKLILII